MREADELNSGSFCSAIIKPEPVRKREKQTNKKNKKQGLPEGVIQKKPYSDVSLFVGCGFRMPNGYHWVRSREP